MSYAPRAERTGLTPHHLLQGIAEAMDDSGEGDGTWDGADVCDAVAAILTRHGYMKRCPTCHLLFAAHKAECPFHGEDEQSFGQGIGA